MKPIISCLAWLPAALWYGLIWSFSAQPAADSGRLSDGLLHHLLIRWDAAYPLQSPGGQAAILEFLSFYARKAAHMALYFVLAALLLPALSHTFRALGKRLPRWKENSLALLLCGGLAAADEFHQTFVPGRSGEVRDVLVDLCGAACFLLLLWLARCVRRAYRSPSTPGPAGRGV